MILSINKPDEDGPSQSQLMKRMSLRLMQAGYRLTRPRQAVLKSICEHAGSFTAGELVASVSAGYPDVGRATVFRTLDLLVGLGILQRVHTEAEIGRGHSYVVCGLDQTHHHHLVCTQCGLITDFEGCGIEDLLARLHMHTSFKVQSHHIELYGLCEHCQTAHIAPSPFEGGRGRQAYGEGP